MSATVLFQMALVLHHGGVANRCSKPSPGHPVAGCRALVRSSAPGAKSLRRELSPSDHVPAAETMLADSFGVITVTGPRYRFAVAPQWRRQPIGFAGPSGALDPGNTARSTNADCVRDPFRSGTPAARRWSRQFTIKDHGDHRLRGGSRRGSPLCPGSPADLLRRGWRPISTTDPHRFDRIIERARDVERGATWPLTYQPDLVWFLSRREVHTRACHQLSQTTLATSWTAARKFRAVFS